METVNYTTPKTLILLSKTLLNDCLYSQYIFQNFVGKTGEDAVVPDYCLCKLL